MILISFIVGGLFGVVGMSLFSASAYEKGWKDGIEYDKD